MHKVYHTFGAERGGGRNEPHARLSLTLTITEEKQHEDQNGISVAGVN